MARTAAALIIGNELLTGKVQDQNLHFLARELFALGVSLRRVIVCPDEMDTIVADLDALRRTHDYVFTSGGIGPTHDDITVEAVARTFGRQVGRSPEVETMIRKFYGDRVTEAHLRLADVPEGAQLIRNASVPWPTVLIENVYVMPGVPEIFQLKFAVLRESLATDQPFVSDAVYTQCDEGELAALLQRLTREHPDVTIGSYPRWRDPDYRVKLTFDGTDPEAVHRATDALVESLPADKVVRVTRSNAPKP
jgi:molybdenum cofactor synthesis domain-containing protein